MQFYFMSKHFFNTHSAKPWTRKDTEALFWQQGGSSMQILLSCLVTSDKNASLHSVLPSLCFNLLLNHFENSASQSIWPEVREASLCRSSPHVPCHTSFLGMSGPCHLQA